MNVSLVAADRGVGAAEVRGVEPLGPDTLVRVDAGGPALVARVHGIPDLRLGDRVGVKLDRRQLHLFDAAGARPPRRACWPWVSRGGGAGGRRAGGRRSFPRPTTCPRSSRTRYPPPPPPRPQRRRG